MKERRKENGRGRVRKKERNAKMEAKRGKGVLCVVVTAAVFFFFFYYFISGAKRKKRKERKRMNNRCQNVGSFPDCLKVAPWFEYSRFLEPELFSV